MSTLTVDPAQQLGWQMLALTAATPAVRTTFSWVMNVAAQVTQQAEGAPAAVITVDPAQYQALLALQSDPDPAVQSAATQAVALMVSVCSENDVIDPPSPPPPPPPPPPPAAGRPILGYPGTWNQGTTGAG